MFASVFKVWWIPGFWLVSGLSRLWQSLRNSPRSMIGAVLWVFIISGSYNAGIRYADSHTSFTKLQQQRGTAIASSDVGTLPPGRVAPGQPPAIPTSPHRTFRNSYVWGHCTWYVAGRRQVPRNWGHARSWYANAQRSGWSVGDTPIPGAIGWTSAGWYGHVVLVERVEGNQVYIAEMNYRGLGVTSHRLVPASSFKYIY